MYAAFHTSPPTDILGPEPYEMAGHEKRFLLQKPLTELTASHLHNFIFEIGVVGWYATTYFMPRLVELALSGQLNESDSDSLRSFLDSAKHKLTEKQRTGLRQYGEGIQKQLKKRGHTRECQELLGLLLSL